MEPTKIFCKECGKGKLQVDTESGEVYCNKCGYVAKNQENEERSLTIEEQSRSAPEKISGQSTVIGGQSDINQKIGAKFKKMKSRMIQMGLWDSQISKSKESQRLDRNDRKFKDLVLLLIPTIGEGFLEHLDKIYFKCLKKNLQRGRSAKSIMIGVICVFALQEKIPTFSFDKCAKKTGVDKKKILESYALIRRELDEEISVSYNQDAHKEITRIVGLIKNDLDSFPAQKITMRADKIIEQVSKSGLTGGLKLKNQAAASIFLACHAEENPISISNISRYAQTTRIKGICEKFNSELKFNIDF